VDSPGTSANLEGLLLQSLEERKRRRSAAIDALLELRRHQRPVSDAEVAAARREGRP